MYSCKFCDFHERHPQHFKEHCAKTHHYCEDCDIQFGSSYAMDDHWMHAHGRSSLAVKVLLKHQFIVEKCHFKALPWWLKKIKLLFHSNPIKVVVSCAWRIDLPDFEILLKIVVLVKSFFNYQLGGSQYQILKESHLTKTVNMSPLTDRQKHLPHSK